MWTESLHTRDWRAVLEVAAEIIDCEQLPNVAAAVQDRVGRLVGCEIASCHELDGARTNLIVHANLAGFPTWTRSRYVSLAHQNPLIAHHLRTGDTRALRLSDFTSTRELRRLELYQRTYRPVGIEHQLSFAFPLRPAGRDDARTVRVSLSRQFRDFTERDRAVLDLLRPFVHHAYHTAFLRGALTSSEPTDRAAEVDSHAPALTDRERNVLAWVRAGHSNTQIATELKISHHTVAKHLQHIYTKLGVTNRTAAAREHHDG